MAEIAWGVKRTCTGCAARFYDLRKSPPTCPKCGTIVELHMASKSRRSKNSAKEIVLPIDDFDISLVDSLEVEEVSDDPTLLEDDDNIDQRLGGISSSLDDDGI